jgi:hypothetical protein
VERGFGRDGIRSGARGAAEVLASAAKFELMVKGSLADRFKKLQKDVGNLVEGAELEGRYCIYLGEFLDNTSLLMSGSTRPTAGRWTRGAERNLPRGASAACASKPQNPVAGPAMPGSHCPEQGF